VFPQNNSANYRWESIQSCLKRVSTFANFAKLELPSRISLRGCEFSATISKFNEHIRERVVAIRNQDDSFDLADYERLLKHDNRDRVSAEFFAFVRYGIFLTDTCSGEQKKCAECQG